MSIKRYLFLLFGALIILLGLSQLLISQYYKGELQNELSERSKVLSQNLVKVLIDNVGSEQEFVLALDDAEVMEAIVDIEEVKADFKHDIEEVTREVAQLAKELSLLEKPEYGELDQEEREAFQALLKEKERELKLHLKEMARHERDMSREQQISIAQARREAAMAYRERLHQAVSQIEIDTGSWLKDSNVVIVEPPAPPVFGDFELQYSHDIRVPSHGTNDQLERFSESMLALILLTSIGALLMAYLLSHYISSPLTKLAKGHQKLGEGDLGFQVEEKGVKELKAILTGFNKMSRKLEKLSEKESRMAQQEQLAELGEVTRGIAHSLRNPLHTIGLLSESAIQADNSAEAAQQLKKIQHKIAMMDKSIQSLLTLSSNEVDRSTSVPLQAIIHDILLELSITGSKPKISFSESDKHYNVSGAESELRSILHGVIINAVEATPDDGEVSVSLDETSGAYHVIVKDTGCGILPEVRERICQPHVTTKTEGTGMGAYIAERLLNGHYGGELMFADNPGGGTVVTISFARTDNNNKRGDEE